MECILDSQKDCFEFCRGRRNWQVLSRKCTVQQEAQVRPRHHACSLSADLVLFRHLLPLPILYARNRKSLSRPYSLYTHAQGVTLNCPPSEGRQAPACDIQTERTTVITDPCLVYARGSVLHKGLSSKPYRIWQEKNDRRSEFATGKSLDSPEKGNVDQMSEKCRKNVRKMSENEP